MVLAIARLLNHGATFLLPPISMRPASIIKRLARPTNSSNAARHPHRSSSLGMGTRLPKSVEQAAHEALKQRPYYDPANSTLDFRKSNKTLLREITAQCAARTRMRLQEPAKKWVLLHGSESAVETLKEQAKDAINSARISLVSSLRPLAVGDVVVLSENSTLLHLVVAAPSTLSLNVYTFINHEGEVTFGTKHHIQMRIPGVLGSQFAERLRLVAIEQKRAGVAPIGVPDSAFSRKPEPTCIPREHASSPLEPELLLPLEPASASLDSKPREFTVDQATAQLLTDTEVKTYVVPTAAREIYASHFTKISIETFSKIPGFGDKLDHFHRVLQYDDSGGMILSARTIPIFDLFSMVMAYKPSALARGSQSKQKSSLPFRHTSDGSIALGRPLPSQTARSYAVATFSASDYIAFTSALMRLCRKWKINIQKSTRTPISVDVMPISRARSVDSTLEYLKNGGVEETATYIASVVQGKNYTTSEPAPFKHVLQVLKDFVSGNIRGDHAMDSLLGSLVRSVDAKLHSLDAEQLAAPAPPAMPFTYEFARLRAYEILMLLEKTGDRNPLRWNSALALPKSETSGEADRFLNFYEYIDSKFQSSPQLLASLQNGTIKYEKGTINSDLKYALDDAAFAQYITEDFYADDPMAAVRTDFGETPVYCIDSETAHEIDDGISIEDLGSHLAITIHVANPTSYLKPDSSLSQIAFEKGSTIYLPEGPTMMLPDVVSQICGLNGYHKTRTLGIRFCCDKQILSSYKKALSLNPSARPKADLAKAIKDAIEQTATVKFYHVSNFPKNFTYLKVNEVLNDPTNVAKFENNEFKKGSHEQNLFSLHMVADLIKHFRVGVGSGIELNSDTTKVTVRYSSDTTHEEELVEIENGWQITLPKGTKDDTPVISVTREINQNNESKSQHLVSNLMIAANYAGSIFAEREGFPIIHRHLELDVKESVAKQIQQLSMRSYFHKKDLKPDEKSQLLSILTTANYLTFQLPHDLLGVKLYSNLTSPLRRYVDMINHWKFQEFTLVKEKERLGMSNPTAGEPQLPRGKSKAREAHLPQWAPKRPKAKKPFSPLRMEFGMRTSDMDYVASHLQGCELKNKMAQRFSDTFWKARFLRRYFELQLQGKVSKPIQLLFLLGSDAKHGDIRAELIGFSSLKTTIIQTPYVTLKFANDEWRVGQVLRNPRFRVLKLDFIEGEFTIELASPDDASGDLLT